MNRTVVINAGIAVLIVGFVSVVFVVDARNKATPTTTTTTSTTSTTLPPTTTTSTTTTSTTTTSTSTTTTTSTVPPSTEVPLPRPLWAVIVVNGTSAGERLAPTIDQLRAADYANLRGLVGSVKTTETVIYYLDDAMIPAVDRLRVDLGLPDVALAPFSAAPPVAGRNDAQLMVYLGGA